MALDRLTVEDFAATLGESYALDLDGTRTVPLTLGTAAALGDAGMPDPATPTRRPFSLVFHGPSDPELPQRTYRLEHASLGTLDVFIVPVARDAEGMRYEAVFG